MGLPAQSSAAPVNDEAIRASVRATAPSLTRRGIKYDPELLYLGAMFHDIGLTDAYSSPNLASRSTAPMRRAS